MGVVAFAPRNLDTVAETARRSPGRAAMVGLAGTFLLIPVWVLGMVALAVSIVGIPVMIAWLPLFPLAAVAAAMLGYLAVARNVGEWLADSGYRYTDWIRKSNPVYTVFGGRARAGALLHRRATSCAVVPFFGFFRGLLTFVGVMLRDRRDSDRLRRGAAHPRRTPAGDGQPMAFDEAWERAVDMDVEVEVETATSGPTGGSASGSAAGSAGGPATGAGGDDVRRTTGGRTMRRVPGSRPARPWCWRSRSGLAAQSWRTVTMSRQLSGEDDLRVQVRYGAGRFKVRPAEEGLLYRMQLRYDEDAFEPQADYEGNRLHLGVENLGKSIHIGKNRSGGEMDLQLARNVPMDLDLEFGAVRADLDLGGLSLNGSS